ncbi:MAG: HlyC/CorC family transporter [Bacteroidales bacterium]|nr:HlyC/CorC family transporter [Bacteroidales bacterium]
MINNQSTVWLLIILSLLLSAFFSGMEIAFVSSSRLKQELDMKKRLLPARILSAFYNHPSRFIGALLLGNNVALVVYGIAMAQILEPVITGILPQSMRTEVYILILQTILATLLILVISEFIPKALFRIHPNALLKTFSIPVWIFYVAFYPVILLYIGISELILRLFFGMKTTTEGYTFSAVDLSEYVQNLQADEQPDQSLNQEIQMIQNAMDFKNLRLRDCMIPRTDIVALEMKESIEVLQRLFSETGHSKIMIFKESIDHIVGYVHAYDLFQKPETMAEILRKLDIYPETMAANTVLNSFIKNHKSIAVVVDEFGGTSGLVTLEDIIEEIFGEIEDEYDVDEEVEKQISETEFIFSARIEIDYLNEKYHLDLPTSDEYGTLAGYILHHYESIPPETTQIEIPPYLFEVLKASDNRLDEVKMTLIN